MFTLKTGIPEFFFDDLNIEIASKLERVVHQPDVSPAAILSADKPWEANMVTLYGTILYDEQEKLFRMWYQTAGKDELGRFRDMFVCLAQSRDGFTWTKPCLGIHTYNGQDTNIVLKGPEGAEFIESASILDEGTESDAGKRYKMIFYAHYKDDPDKLLRSGIYRAWSGNGINWSTAQRISGMGDRGNMCPVKIDGRYVYFGRRNYIMRDYNCRNCWNSHSEDFENWSEPKLLLTPGLPDGTNIEFYAMSGFRLEGQYLGLLQILHTEGDLLDVELISSRDGIQWNRVCPGKPFMSCGCTDWCTTWIDFPSNGPVCISDQWYWYVAGRTFSHGAKAPQPFGKIGIATQSKNCAVSITARQNRGVLETRPICGKGRALKILCRPQFQKHWPDGEIKVDLLTVDGKEFPDFSQGCAGNPDSSGWRTVQWNNKSRNIAEVFEKGFRIKFHMRNAHLFAYTLG